MGFISSISRGVNGIIKAIGSGVEKTRKFLWSYATEGYSASAEFMMPDHEPLQDEHKATKKHGFLVSVLPFLTLYMPGLIAGATIIPLVYLTIENFKRFRELPNNRIEFYRKIPSERVPNELKKIHYAAGRSSISKIFGVIGAPLGLIIGTIFAPELYKGIALETYESWEIWAKIGFELARTDELDSLRGVFAPTIDDNRSRLAKILGYNPLGIPLTIALFTIVATGHTLARIAVNSSYSLANSFVFFLQKSLFDLKTEISTPYPEQRNNYKQILGLPGLIIGSAIGIGISSIVIGVRVVWESAKNFGKWLSKGFYVPFSDERHIEYKVYKFSNYDLSKLKITKPYSITRAFHLTWSENLLGAPGYLLAPVAATLGFLGGSAVRIAVESFISTYNTGIAVISRMAFRGVTNYPHPDFIENRKGYEHAVGILGYPVGLITVPVAALILSVRYLITNYDTANRAFYYLSRPIMPPKRELEADNRPKWVKAISAPGAILGGTLGSLVRITGESVYTFKQLLKNAVKFSLTDAPRELHEHDRLNTNIAEPSTNTKYWGIPGLIIGIFVALPTATAILIGRLALTNGTSFKREFAQIVNPKITKETRKFNIAEVDERSSLLQNAGTPGYALGWIFGQLGTITIDSWAHLENAVMRSMKVAADEHPLVLKGYVKLNPNIESHSKYRGAPGIIIGYTAGFIAASVFATGRILYNTADSIRHVTLDMVKFVRHDGEDFPKARSFVMLSRLRKGLSGGYTPATRKETGALNDSGDDQEVPNTLDDTYNTTQPKTRTDERLKTPFRLGVLGIPLGGIVGLLAASTVGFLRFIAQSTVTAWNFGLSITRASLPSNEAFNIDEKFQAKQTKKVDIFMGSPGVIPGFALGVVGFLIGGTLRTLVNTGITFGYAIYNIGTLPPVSEYLPELLDNRERTDKALGAPLGYLLGAPFGIVFYGLHITVHIVINSGLSGYYNLQKMTRWALGDRINKFLLGQNPSENLHINNNSEFFGKSYTQRNPKEKYAFGFLGHVISGVLGIAIDSVIITGRILWHSLIKSTILGFKQFTNFAKTQNMKSLPETSYDNTINKIALPILKTPLTVPAKILSGLKHIIGLPGLALGTAVSAVFWIVPNYAYEAYQENVKSYGHLAKSLINLGGEAFYFKKGGLAADKRSWQRQAIGTPGYILALATAGLVPLANALIIKVPAILIGLASMPFVGVYKALKARKVKSVNAQDLEEATPLNRAEGLRKMLYLGDLDENMTRESIQMRSTYLGYICDSLRRLISFDQDSYTEALLAARIECENDRDDTKFRTTVNKIKEEAHAMHIPLRAVREQYNQDINDEIDSVNDWIGKYTQSGTIAEFPTKTYTRNSLLFFKDPDDEGRPDDRNISNTVRDAWTSRTFP